MRASIASITIGLLFAVQGCKKEESLDPEAGSNMLGPSGGAQDDEFGGSGDDYEDAGSDEMGMGEDAEGGMEGEAVAASDQSKLPPRAEPVEKCKGKGKKRTCGLTDPKPKVSAAYGVRTLMGDFRWGMSPKDVLKVLGKDIEKEYSDRQTKAKANAVEQDRNRRWRDEQMQALKANHVKFASSTKHKWGVSLIQFEYEDDAEEEMIWVKANPTLRKFYFFKNGELWKVFYAYSTDTWPGQAYDQVKEEKFKKWFGVSPDEKVKQDPETKQPVLRYTEWTAMNNERIRAFDMTDVHGVLVLAVVDGTAEKRIGERLPNIAKKEAFSDVVNDVLGQGDVCYNKAGEIVECKDPSGYVQ